MSNLIAQFELTVNRTFSVHNNVVAVKHDPDVMNNLTWYVYHFYFVVCYSLFETVLLQSGAENICVSEWLSGCPTPPRALSLGSS